MRNLKRALSLALAAAMVIGMMVIGASAASTYEDFTDKDEIQHSEAVATMVSLGVLAGKEDGSYFDPSGTVTRAEMAKIVAVCLSGGVDPVTGSDSTTVKFSDVPVTHWAYKYISFCVQQNIIAGRGDGTFGPEDPVTGSAAAKMFLCALGYSAEYHGLVGNDWEINTNVLANQNAGLYDGLNGIDASKGLSRDATAQMAYNAVQADEIDYTDGNLINGVPPMESNGTMLWNRFKVVKVTGILEANDVMALRNSPAKEGKLRFENGTVTVPDFTAQQIANMGNVFTVSASNTMVGQEIVIYVKFQNNLAPNAADSAVLGQPILTNSNTVYETSAKMATEQKVRDAIKGDGLSVDGSTVSVYFDEDGRAAASPYAGGVVDGAGLYQRFIDNDNNGTVDYIIQELPALAKVTNLNTAGEKITFTGNVGTQDFEDVSGYEELAKDDFVLIISYDDGKYYVTKAETVSGAVSAYNSDSVKITIDGKAYGRALDFADYVGIPGLNNTGMDAMVGDSYTLYLDAYGNVKGQAFVEAALSNLAVVVSSGVSANALGVYNGTVKLLLADGTYITRDVNMLDSAKKLGATGAALASDTTKRNWTTEALTSGIPATAFNDALTGADNKDGMKFEIVSYSEDTEGGTVTLSLPSVNNTLNYQYTNTAAGTVKVSNKITSYNVGQTMLADNNTVFFIYNEQKDTFSVVTGVRNLSSSELTSAALTAANSNQNGKTAVALGYQANRTETLVAKGIVLCNDGVDAYTATSNYAYILAKTTKVGDDLYQYSAVLQDGTTAILTSKDDTFEDGTVIAYSLDASGYAVEDTAITVHENVNGTSDGIYNGYVVDYTSGSSVAFKSGYNATNTASFALSGTVDMFGLADIELNDDGTVNGGDASVAAVDALGKWMSTCFVVEDGEIKYVFVDDNNAVFADVTNRLGGNQTINGAVIANGGFITVAGGYPVEVTTNAGGGALPYNYTVSSRYYEELAESTTGTSVSFTMPANTTSGVVLPAYNSAGAATNLAGAVSASLTNPTTDQLTAALSAVDDVTVNGVMSVGAEETLNVGAGQTLTLAAGSNVTVEGKIANSGVISLPEGSNAQLTIADGGELAITSFATTATATDGQLDSQAAYDTAARTGGVLVKAGGKLTVGGVVLGKGGILTPAAGDGNYLVINTFRDGVFEGGSVRVVGNATLSGDLTVGTTAGILHFGIRADATLTVEDGATLSAGSANNRHVGVDGTLVVKSGGKIVCSDNFPGFAAQGSGAKAITLEQGAIVNSARTGLFTDQGTAVTTTNSNITVGASDAGASASGLTAGDYVSSGVDPNRGLFVKAA